MSSISDYLAAFLIGGALCVVGQLLISLTRLTPARILVLFVTMGVFFSTIGLYQSLVDFAGAGATIPLSGFGHSLAQGAVKAAKEDGILGAFTGGIKATAGGISAAILFGYINAVIFTPKTKK